MEQVIVVPDPLEVLRISEKNLAEGEGDARPAAVSDEKGESWQLGRRTYFKLWAYLCDSAPRDQAA